MGVGRSSEVCLCIWRSRSACWLILSCIRLKLSSLKAIEPTDSFEPTENSLVLAIGCWSGSSTTLVCLLSRRSRYVSEFDIYRLNGEVFRFKRLCYDIELFTLLFRWLLLELWCDSWLYGYASARSRSLAESDCEFEITRSLSSEDWIRWVMMWSFEMLCYEFVLVFELCPP